MAKRRADYDVTTASFGLRCWRGEPPLMSRAHRHNDVELNYLECGSITYLFGGQRVELRAGDACLFWAAMPHQLVDQASGPVMYWVTLPLALFLHWGLPEPLARAVLNGTPVTRHDTWDEGFAVAAMSRWHDELGQSDPEATTIVRLELEAYLRRFARSALESRPRMHNVDRPTSSAEQMARMIAAHYSEPLTVDKIAASVGLHPRYAMTVFREAYGVSLMVYLTQHRVAHAQQLLVTSNMGVLEIALESGFGSTSRFYSAFKTVCGTSPAAYRATLRAG